MTIHKEGLGTIITAIVIFIAINILTHRLLRPDVFEIVFVITVVLLVLVATFFRSPRRHNIEREGAIIAPADGKIVVIEECYEPEVLKCQCLQVSIFMSLFNVHINWYPVSGTIRYVRHHLGNFHAAYLPKSSSENERTSVVIELKTGEKVLVRQVAGALARRIICYAKEDYRAKQANQMGFIKFGSRVDMYLPLGSKIDTQIGDKVTGSQTVIGWIK